MWRVKLESLGESKSGKECDRERKRKGVEWDP
jgi:hypothetical protein